MNPKRVTAFPREMSGDMRQRGKIGEIGKTEVVVSNPQRPYTKALTSVIPAADSAGKREHTILTGETPDPPAIPMGCGFHRRCPEVMGICPQRSSLDGQTRGSHYAACRHLNGDS
jgi:oligopeptide/dipeptide ABC transporter ATP-binding protein